jgi:hypothetical protein
MNIQTGMFLFVITALCVYFIMVNKPGTSKEHFAQAQQQQAVTQAPTPVVPKAGSISDDDDKVKGLGGMPEAYNKDLIKKIYQDLFKRDPVDEEVKFYLDYIKTRTITETQLIEVISTTAPILRKTIPEQSLMSNTVFGTEDEVILAYNQILDRNPNVQELKFNASKMKTDKNFTMDKLIQLLVASEEYSRLQKMQVNTAYGTLLGGVTDRQITLTVQKIYSDVANGKEADRDTEKFLKKKFVEFNLDEKKLADFTKSYVANSPFCATKPTTQEYNLVLTETIKKTERQQQQQIIGGSGTSQEAKKTVTTTKTAPGAPAGARKENFATGSKEDGQVVYNNSQVYNVYVPNQEILSSLMNRMTTESEYELDSQGVIDEINKKAECTFNKNKKNETMLSDEVYNRNMTQMGATCERNTAFLNADTEFVLRPDQRWSVPQKRPPVCTPASKCKVTDSVDQTSLIGTPLTDAKSTSVGSILPYHPPV